MTTKGAYYNEIDEYAVEWLENLIAAGHIADGVVDRRSIAAVSPDDLKEFTQCHFFAGIGVWSYALRQAGWNDDRPVWTGSCPCQPFSSAGEGKGFNDERHLWPEFYRLIEARRPETVMGEQVASNDGLAWLDLVFADLENSHYAVRAVDTCAAGFGAPHVRQRLYWVADSNHPGLEGYGRFERFDDAQGRQVSDGHSSTLSLHGRLADANGRDASAEWQQRGGQQRLLSEGGGVIGLAHTASTGLEVGTSEQGWSGRKEFGSERLCTTDELDNGGRSGPTNGMWRDADWLFCRDGKWRPVRPKTFPLVNGATSRMGRLRAYGNAINAHQARGFIESVMLSTDVEPRTVLSDYADIADLL